MIQKGKIAGKFRLASAIAAITAASGVAAVHAQEQTAPSATGQQSLQEVVITGSLIRRPASETAEAVTVITADGLRQQGITSVEQALNTLTSNVPAINIASSVGEFTGGGTYANLRGLGEGRTLVLLDGERLAPNAFSGNAVDLSGIPFSAVDSIQVLREGASSLYGSDAIAGVINFITKKNFQGVEIGGTINRPQEAGGSSQQADFTLGHGDLVNDGYNFLITGSYNRQLELKATQRSFSAEGFDPARGVFNTNNPGSWPGSVQDANNNLWQSGYPTCAGNPLLTRYFGNCAYRYSAATDLLPDSYEASGLAEFTKALPGNNQLQLQYFYTQSQAAAWSGPMFYFFQMNPASPYFPKASQLTCIGTCSGPPDLTDPISAVWTDPNNNRYSGNLNTEQRVLLKFSGANAGWDYAGTLNYSQNKNDNRNTAGYPNEYGPPAQNGGVLAPGGVLSTLINPFGPQSAAGQALINSSYINGTYSIGEDKRWSADGTASHELGEVPNAGRPATLALGFSVGGERFQYNTTPYNDLVQAATGLTASAIEGSRQTQALFFELDAPISRSFDLDLADRWDRYSDFGTTQNAKVTLRYQPTSFLTFRGAASTGFRAPTLFDLYQPNNLSASTSGTMGEGNPNCAATPPIAPFTTATCNTQGLGLFGGNRNLTPETSDNFDLGVIVQPVSDMGITLDYYRILLKNTINTLPASAIYGNPTQFASYIVTNNAGGLTPSIQEGADCTPYTQPTCGYIKQYFQNTGRISTDGIDLSIQYAQRTRIGTFREDLEGTAVTQFQQQEYTGGPFVNLVGWYNTAPPAYRWQHFVRFDWTSPQDMWGGGISNRFYSRYIDQFPDGNNNQRMVGSYSTWDGYASVKPVRNLTVLFGVKNLFNTLPPFTNANQNNFAAGYNALVVDPNLRTYYVNLRYSF